MKCLKSASRSKLAKQTKQKHREQCAHLFSTRGLDELLALVFVFGDGRDENIVNELARVGFVVGSQL